MAPRAAMAVARDGPRQKEHPAVRGEGHSLVDASPQGAHAMTDTLLSTAILFLAIAHILGTFGRSKLRRRIEKLEQESRHDQP